MTGITSERQGSAAGSTRENLGEPHAEAWVPCRDSAPLPVGPRPRGVGEQEGGPIPQPQNTGAAT